MPRHPQRSGDVAPFAAAQRGHMVDAVDFSPAMIGDGPPEIEMPAWLFVGVAR